MKVPRGRRLGQDAPQCEVRGIGLDGDRQVWLEMSEDGGRGEGLLESREGCSRRLRPEELDGFAGKCSEGVAMAE